MANFNDVRFRGQEFVVFKTFAKVTAPPPVKADVVRFS